MSTPTIQQAAAFLRQHGAHPKNWSEEVIMPWLEWHWKNGGVAIVHDKGEIFAVAVGRCIRAFAEADDPYMHHEDGAILWVDELASLRPEGLPLLLNLARDRFGPRLAVTGHVFNRPGKLRMLPWKTVERIIQQHIPQP